MRKFAQSIPLDSFGFHLLFTLKSNLMLTFNFNPARRRQPETMAELLGNETICIDTAKRQLRDFFNRSQRQTFGRSWHRQDLRPWPEVYGFCEHADTNFHYHTLVTACPRLWETLYGRGQGIWAKIQKGGTLDVRQVWDLPGAVEYCTKELWRPGMSEARFEYSDPRPALTEDAWEKIVRRLIISRLPPDEEEPD